MRKDITFSDRKLTTEEFSKKYWLNGSAQYQYHTGTIEDGRDEREQFVFNNIRALWDLIKSRSTHERNARGKTEDRIEKLTKKVAILAVTSMAANVALIIAICILWNKI